MENHLFLENTTKYKLTCVKKKPLVVDTDQRVISIEIEVFVFEKNEDGTYGNQLKHSTIDTIRADDYTMCNPLNGVTCEEVITQEFELPTEENPNGTPLIKQWKDKLGNIVESPISQYQFYIQLMNTPNLPKSINEYINDAIMAEVVIYLRFRNNKYLPTA